MNNDLISREALKEEVKTLFCPDGYKIMMLERIDNAPTVTDRTEEVLSLQNTIAKLVEGIAENARPQGEWKQISPAKIYECNLCHKTVMTSDIEEYRFCHGCGAKMQKGGAE